MTFQTCLFKIQDAAPPDRKPRLCHPAVYLHLGHGPGRVRFPLRPGLMRSLSSDTVRSFSSWTEAPCMFTSEVRMIFFSLVIMYV